MSARHNLSSGTTLGGAPFFMPGDRGHGLRPPFLPVFAPEGGAPGGSTEGGEHDDPPEHEDDDIPEAPVRKPARELYREPTSYEKRLRTENAKLRQRALAAEQAARDAGNGTKGEMEQKLAEARAAADAALAAEKAERERALTEAKAEGERSVTEARSAAERRIIRAEVRAAAITAGLLHVKGLDMLDLSEVKLDEKGDLVLPENYFEKAKEEYPFLFAEPKDVRGQEPPKTGSTSNPQNPPPQTPPTSKKGMEMTADEWKTAQRELMQGRIPGR